jgi:nucleoside-diphosphate-sugar epimerase
MVATGANPPFSIGGSKTRRRKGKYSKKGGVLSNFISQDFVNLGSGLGYSIRKLVETMHEFIDFEFEFDSSMPAGFPKRVMDISRAREWVNYDPKTSLREGLENTWKWFLENKDEYLQKQNYFKL